METEEKKTEELIKVQQYDIFNIVENYNEGVNIGITIGNYMLENNFESVEDAKKYIDSKPYKLVCAIASIYSQIIINDFINTKKNEN